MNILYVPFVAILGVIYLGCTISLLVIARLGELGRPTNGWVVFTYCAGAEFCVACTFYLLKAT